MKTTPITNAFTCTGPYAILILMGLKRVENQSAWPEPVEGRCAMSVSKKFCCGEYDNFMRWLEGHCAPELREIMPKWEDVQDWPGKIVGTVDYRVQRLLGKTGCPHGVNGIYNLSIEERTRQ